uniref:Uncharacterized protein n=1 Tax=Capra hircus TaxID=9925 RepID=A0A8C2NGR4_CAPHI
MSGNKGRGHAAYTFNIEAVGFSRGEKLLEVLLKPPPLFLDTDYKPVPLKKGESEDYMLALKQELRETAVTLLFITTDVRKERKILMNWIYRHTHSVDLKYLGIILNITKATNCESV